MRRTLSRPMFRKGGTVPRQGYAPGDIVKQIRPTEEEVQFIHNFQQCQEDQKTDLLMIF